jgi:hypothetical protein
VITNPVADLLRQRRELELQLERLDALLESMAFETICGQVDDTQDVEFYDGTLGVTIDFVMAHERPVGQLQWLNDLAERFAGVGEAPGDVSGARWGSGCLFRDDLFLTAGHCFDQFGGGWQRPSRDGQTIVPREIATLMQVNFNYQIDGQTRERRAGESFPVVELLEFRGGGLDYAIARVGPNGDGVLPGQIYGTLPLALQDLITPQAMLCMIQHPAGKPKMIEAGPLLANVGNRLSYDSMDTLGGSSGSAILSLQGEVVGVHTNGGCNVFSGANFGVAIGSIRAVSSFVG